jgi:hypothetical protein
MCTAVASSLASPLSGAEAIPAYCEAVPRLAQDYNYHACTEHVDICPHFICDVIECGDVKACQCLLFDVTT